MSKPASPDWDMIPCVTKIFGDILLVTNPLGLAENFGCPEFDALSMLIIVDNNHWSIEKNMQISNVQSLHDVFSIATGTGGYLNRHV